MSVIAHLSDVHIDSDARSQDRTRAVMAYLDGLGGDLDAVVVTGDIADHAAPEEYETARKLLRSRHPVLICPGNHDERAAFRQYLLGEPAADAPVNQVLRLADCTIALADTSRPGRDDGRLDDATLAWLRSVLTEADRPVLVGFHHPPIELHIPFVDAIRQFGVDRLAELARQPRLAGFLCGHAHTAAVGTFAGRPVVVAPGVVSSSRLRWERPGHAESIVHLDQPPAVAFHVLDSSGLTVHYRTVVT